MYIRIKIRCIRAIHLDTMTESASTLTVMAELCTAVVNETEIEMLLTARFNKIYSGFIFCVVSMCTTTTLYYQTDFNIVYRRIWSMRKVKLQVLIFLSTMCQVVHNFGGHIGDCCDLIYFRGGFLA